MFLLMHFNIFLSNQYFYLSQFCVSLLRHIYNISNCLCAVLISNFKCKTYEYICDLYFLLHLFLVSCPVHDVYVVRFMDTFVHASRAIYCSDFNQSNFFKEKIFRISILQNVFFFRVVSVLSTTNQIPEKFSK